MTSNLPFLVLFLSWLLSFLPRAQHSPHIDVSYRICKSCDAPDYVITVRIFSFYED